jgi:hypothetical protein
MGGYPDRVWPASGTLELSNGEHYPIGFNHLHGYDYQHEYQWQLGCDADSKVTTYDINRELMLCC